MKKKKKTNGARRPQARPHTIFHFHLRDDMANAGELDSILSDGGHVLATMGRGQLRSGVVQDAHGRQAVINVTTLLIRKRMNAKEIQLVKEAIARREEDSPHADLVAIEIEKKDEADIDEDDLGVAGH